MNNSYEQAMKERLDAGPPGQKEVTPTIIVTIKFSVFTKIIRWLKERIKC